MAKKKGGAKGKDKKVAPKKKKEGSKLWTLYESGSVKRKSCPKCGAGVFMAQHKNRTVCGKCAYVEVIAAKKEE